MAIFKGVIFVSRDGYKSLGYLDTAQDLPDVTPSTLLTQDGQESLTCPPIPLKEVIMEVPARQASMQAIKETQPSLDETLPFDRDLPLSDTTLKFPVCHPC